MPVMDCMRDGKKGKKFGADGFCYLGKDAESKAKAQGSAIEASKHGDKKK